MWLGKLCGYMPTDNGSGGLAARIRAARERVQEKEETKREKRERKRKAKRAKERASARRVEMGEAKTASERVRVASQEASEAASETRELANDAKELVAVELGVNESQASNIIQQGRDAIASAKDGVSQFDADGDGDTDIFAALEGGGFEAVDAGQGGQAGQGQDGFEPPVGDVEDDFDDLKRSGVEAELGFDYPIEDDI